jgi:hypothetical protein
VLNPSSYLFIEGSSYNPWVYRAEEKPFDTTPPNPQLIRELIQGEIEKK